MLFTIDSRFVGSDHGSSTVGRVAVQRSSPPVVGVRPEKKNTSSPSNRIERPGSESVVLSSGISSAGPNAVTVLADVIPLTVAARKVVLEEDQVAFRKSLVPRELATDLCEPADVLVAHDERRAPKRQLVLADVGAAHGDFHFQERGVRRQVRKVELAQFRCGWPDFQSLQRLSGTRDILQR